MTIEEFMQKFEEVAPAYKWFLRRGQFIRTSGGCCPIEVIAKADPGNAMRASKDLLRLSVPDANCLLAAADGATVSIRTYPKELRSEMLRITGLA